MNWIALKSESDLNQLIELSFQTEFGIAIFKHSTRCSISSVAKMRLSSFWNYGEELPIYYLDILSFRTISKIIAEQFDVNHESPQLIIIKNGKAIYTASHLEISVKDLRLSLEVKS
ncbi:MAG: bacillithiol system redox-active protein YtxJ [Flavobacteriales bacterium CG_4_10_14_0_2_um_filter_32_8]|nr:MAG: bacillithiol system redox-active protein YtxJ [Flavobacteriales bacterium CG_4_10_14_0_2_um_filter_32_8]PJB14979.1 MAG: bacillithiol system redox-active protein YtxJ [Flavobacteriales bacterium CG_4_9_14_3_um_filter_32_8]